MFFQVVFLTGMFVMQAGAQENSFDFETMSVADRDAILTNEEDILEDLNTVLEAEQLDFTLDEVLTDEFVRIYVDTEIFALDTDDQEAILSELMQGSYVYTCKAVAGDVRIEYTLALQSELDDEDLEVLTDDEIEELSEKVGKWCVSSVSVLEAEDDCYTELLDAVPLDAYDEVVLAGSLSGFRYPVAIGFAEGQAAEVITLRDDSVYEIMEYIPDTAAVSGEEQGYDYDTIAGIVREQYLKDDSAQDGIGGGGSVTAAGAAFPVRRIVIPVVVIIAAVIAVFGIQRKVRKKAA